MFAALEQCDAGAANGPGYGQCDEQCTVNRCGDGELDVGHEECDAGERNGTGRDGEGGMAGCGLDCGFAGRRIFLSSQSFTGDMGTGAGADVACQAMAAAAGFKRSDRFRALLADADGAPNSFVEPIGDGLPFILPTGQIVAASYPALIKVGPGAGITTTEQGEVLFKKLVWTNVNPVGDAYLKEPMSTCAGWTSDDLTRSARVGYNAMMPGDPGIAEWKAKKQWLSHSIWSCTNPLRIYCIEAS